MRILTLLLTVIGAAGCAATATNTAHDDLELALTSGPKTRLRTDLPPAEAQVFLNRFETLEEVVDTAFPFLKPLPQPPLAIVVVGPGRFGLHAKDHGNPVTAGAFTCPEGGELFYRYRHEEWAVDGPPYPMEPRIRPLASAVLRRRLLATYGARLQPTWLEEGLAQVFVELAAAELRDPGWTARQTRNRLLDAYLPLYLGERPALGKLLLTRGRSAMKRWGTRALAWAAVRYLLLDPKRTELLGTALAAASGDPLAEQALAAALTQLDERAFESFLQQAVLESLFAAIQREPTPVDRWEAAAALRLVANMDLKTDLGDDLRARQAQQAQAMLSKRPPPVRFLEQFLPEVTLTARARSRLQAQAKLNKHVRREFKRRSQGYGHPAVDQAERHMGRAIQRAILAVENRR